MRRVLLFHLLTATSAGIYAQAYEDKIEYNKDKQACLVMEYKFPPEAVENAFVSRMNKLGYKGRDEKGVFNKDKGFTVYKNATIAEISPGRYDYIINIDRKSRKESDETMLYLLIMKDGANALSRLNTDELGKAKDFLYNLLPEIDAASLELQITAQEETVSRAEKKLKTLQDDKDELEKKIKKLQDDLEDNIKAQEKQSAEIENQRKALDAMKARRKKN
jgi:DNA repair exonuclease SbcCD ATPase subunit